MLPGGPLIRSREKSDGAQASPRGLACRGRLQNGPEEVPFLKRVIADANCPAEARSYSINAESESERNT